ncbi:Dyp-type peroxidase [Dankookia sp. P2]|uniref:Dyp-type peroxidase n=1 Tax=Dankookia sp. P2 TaxID=3423955 RepID=UPI003D66CC8D
MSTLDLHDIQGNIHRPYGRYGFPYARYFLFHVNRRRDDPRRWDSEIARWLVDQIRPAVTTAEPWRNAATPAGAPVRDKPAVTLNIAFTWAGLNALELPVSTLRLMPDEFIQGMAGRNTILGDLEASAPESWDTVWRNANIEDEKAIHVWVSLNAQAEPSTGLPVPDLEVWTRWLVGLTEHPFARGRLTLLRGHGRRPDGRAPAEDRWQDSGTIMARGPDGVLVPTPREPFGFTDGISDPVFTGQGVLEDDPAAALGSGKIRSGPFDAKTSWAPLSAGEFLLGQASEGQELPVASVPGNFMRNGTFMALRKLHQNTAAFEAAMTAHAEAFGRTAGIADPTEARETLMAKMVGRWPSGVPLVLAPTKQDERAFIAPYLPVLAKVAARLPLDAAERARAAEFDRKLRDYRYTEDPDGVRCPLGSHVRRVNPRDMLDPDHKLGEASTQLTNRRRILRRGLPYGDASPAGLADDGAEHGVFIMALCSSLFRQFEFIQQQWLHYGLDLDSGNDACPITGRRDPHNPLANKFVVQSDPRTGRAPYIAANLPMFVETHGGEYFFIPSITALRMMAMGSVDPT